MLVGVVDSEQRVLRRSTATTRGLTQDEVLAGLERELRTALDACPDAAAAGLGIPCTMDRSRGVAIQAVNLDLANVPIRDLMTERLGLPVFVDNDANVAAIAEHRFGAGRGAENMVMLTVGTGIGGGLILGGRPYRGSTGAAAELGHMVIGFNGPRCQGSCRSNGCVESFASGTALAREGLAAAEREPDSILGRRLTAGETIDGKAVTDAGAEGDEAARRAIELIGSYLGVALSNLANIFDPDVMVVGGGVIAAGELLLGPARAEVAARALRPMSATPVVAAELGPEAGMIGAAAMAAMELEA